MTPAHAPPPQKPNNPTGKLHTILTAELPRGRCAGLEAGVREPLGKVCMYVYTYLCVYIGFVRVCWGRGVMMCVYVHIHLHIYVHTKLIKTQIQCEKMNKGGGVPGALSGAGGGGGGHRPRRDLARTGGQSCLLRVYIHVCDGYVGEELYLYIHTRVCCHMNVRLSPSSSLSVTHPTPPTPTPTPNTSGASQAGVRPGPPLAAGAALRRHRADASLGAADGRPLGAGDQGGGPRAVGLQVCVCVLVGGNVVV